MSNLSTIVATAVEAIDAEIEQLQDVRIALMDLVDLPEAVGKRGPSKRAIERASRQIEAELSSPAMEEALENATALLNGADTVAEDPATRKALADAKLDKIAATEKKNGGTGSQRDRIVAMLRKGTKPSVIANELHTNVSYVYTIRKQEEAKREKVATTRRNKRNGNRK